MKEPEYHLPGRVEVELLVVEPDQFRGDLNQRIINDTLVIGYCDYHPVARISACDTILPIQNLAKNDILLL